MTVTLQQCQQNLVLEFFLRCNSATHKMHVAIYLCDPSEFNGSIKESSRSDDQGITSSTINKFRLTTMTNGPMGLKTTENILNISKTNIKETSFD